VVVANCSRSSAARAASSLRYTFSLLSWGESNESSGFVSCHHSRWLMRLQTTTDNRHARRGSRMLRPRAQCARTCLHIARLDVLSGHLRLAAGGLV
jgi:hypothetical protein